MQDIFRQRLLWLAAAVVVLSVTPASAQISNGPQFGLAPGAAYRNNVAYDSINQVYLVIVARPPVTGRFYDKNGNQIGSDFIIATEPGFAAWVSVAFGGPSWDPTFIVTYIKAEGLNPKFGRLVRYASGSANISAPSWIVDVGAEWVYAEKAQNVWNGQNFIVGSRVKNPGAAFPTFQVNLFGLNGFVSGGVDLGDGQDYYGSPALSCAANGTCLAVGYMAGIPSGYTGGTYGRLFDGASITPLGAQFALAAGLPNEDQGVVYQAHLGRFLTQWFRGGGPGYIDTRIVGTDGSMSALDLNRGIGPEAGTNMAAYNPATQTTLLLMKSVGATLWALELGDDGYPKNPNNWAMQTLWDGKVLDYHPSIGTNGGDGSWLVTWTMQNGGYGRLIYGNASAPPPASAVQNGDFNNGLNSWIAFGSPNPGDIVANVNGGVLEFYRQPSGGTNSAVVLQSTGQAAGSATAIAAQFDLGNSSAARKRMTVLLHDSDFSDLQFCTFWLEPFAPMRTYRMRTHTTEGWANATLSFYAATEGSDGGAYRLDNVSVTLNAPHPNDRTDCVDPTSPGTPGGPESSELISNGTFGSFLFGWQLYGQISTQVSGGVFQFVRPAGSPAGSLLQATGATTSAGTLMTARFDLGNTSGTRKRVTVLLHDLNFSDLQGCSFWLAPGQALTSYVIRTYTPRAWSNATVSFFLGNVDTTQWARIDNVSLKRTPSETVIGTECMLATAQGASINAVTSDSVSVDSTPVPTQAGTPWRSARPRTPIALDSEPVGPLGSDTSEWTMSGGFARLFGRTTDSEVWASTVPSGASGEIDRLAWSKPIDLRNANTAVLEFMSRRTGDAGSAAVEVSLDGVSWTELADVPASDAWGLVSVDLSDYMGQVVFIRFAHAPSPAGTPALWHLTRVGVVRN